MHLFEYKLQRCPYKGTIVYIFQIVFCVCYMYSTCHTVMDTCTFTNFILFCSIIQSMFQELNKKVIQNKLLQRNYVLSSTDKHVKVDPKSIKQRDEINI